MLSTIPDKTIKTPRRLIATKVTVNPTKFYNISTKVFITPVLTDAPTIMNKQVKKIKVPHSTPLTQFAIVDQV